MLRTEMSGKLTLQFSDTVKLDSMEFQNEYLRRKQSSILGS